MSKYVKGLLQGELENRFSDVSDFLVVETKGVGGNDNNEMRGALREKGIRLSVVKNSMMRRASTAMDMADAVDLFLAGPCTVAFGGDSVVDVAKEIADWAKKLDAVEIRGAFVDGKAVDASDAKSLAKMKSRAELQGDIVMLANSPGSNLAGALAGPGGVIAGCIESLIEKLEEAA
jgi:large subunit ribosomal protein L10